MKDSLSLLGVALIVSGFGWAFWHYLGANGFNVIVLVALVVSAVDNYRLRRQLKK